MANVGVFEHDGERLPETAVLAIHGGKSGNQWKRRCFIVHAGGVHFHGNGAFSGRRCLFGMTYPARLEEQCISIAYAVGG